MNILITGATSGIGKQLATDYHNQGHQVWAVDRNESALKELQRMGMKTGRLDLTERDVCDETHVMVANSNLDKYRTKNGEIMTRHSIAIIGTGISGLTCAHHLAAHHDLTIYESEAYIGGHTHTVQVERDGEVFWLLVIWIGLAMTIHHSFAWLKDKLLVAALFGGLGGPAAYWAGTRMGAASVTWSLPISLLALAVIWSLLFPTIMLFSRKAQRFQ